MLQEEDEKKVGKNWKKYDRFEDWTQDLIRKFVKDTW